MSRALPRSRAAVPAFTFVDRGPRFTSPAGVTLRQLGEHDLNTEPVLVCAGCNRPTLHERGMFDGRPTGHCRCRTCSTERRW